MNPPRLSNTRRTTGAAAWAPNPDCSSTAATTYLGEPTGPNPTNRDVSNCASLPAVCAVPVLPASGYWESGNVEKTGAAVPFAEVTAPISPDRSGRATSGGRSPCKHEADLAVTRRTLPSPRRVPDALAMFGEYTVPPFANVA